MVGVCPPNDILNETVKAEGNSDADGGCERTRAAGRQKEALRVCRDGAAIGGAGSTVSRDLGGGRRVGFVSSSPSQSRKIVDAA